jgi:hypothetical protein
LNNFCVPDKVIQCLVHWLVSREFPKNPSTAKIKNKVKYKFSSMGQEVREVSFKGNSHSLSCTVKVEPNMISL